MPTVAYIAEIAREAREDRGIRRELVAATADRSVDVIRRFERGIGGGSLDVLMDAYAEATGLTVAELLARAAERAAEEAQD